MVGGSGEGAEGGEQAQCGWGCVKGGSGGGGAARVVVLGQQ